MIPSDASRVLDQTLSLLEINILHSDQQGTGLHGIIQRACYLIVHDHASDTDPPIAQYIPLYRQIKPTSYTQLQIFGSYRITEPSARDSRTPTTRSDPIACHHCPRPITALQA